MASTEQRPGMLLNVLQGTEQPPQPRILQLQISIASLLRNPVLNQQQIIHLKHIIPLQCFPIHFQIKLTSLGLKSLPSIRCPFLCFHLYCFNSATIIFVLTQPVVLILNKRRKTWALLLALSQIASVTTSTSISSPVKQWDWALLRRATCSTGGSISRRKAHLSAWHLTDNQVCYQSNEGQKCNKSGDQAVGRKEDREQDPHGGVGR